MVRRSSSRHSSTNLSTIIHVPTTLVSSSGTVNCDRNTSSSSSKAKAKAKPRVVKKLKPGFFKLWKWTVRTRVAVRTRAAKAPPKSGATTTITRNRGSNSKTKTKTRVDSRQAFCEICAEKKHNDEMMITNQSCFHSFCSICITNQVRNRITEAQATVPCLALGCNQAADFHTCAGILPQDVRERWDRALCEVMTRVDSRQAFCEICAENKYIDEMMITNQSCSHPFCSICITNQVRTRITEAQATVPCLALGCNQAAEFHTCAGILPEDVRDRWDRALCEALILAEQKFYCPFRDCSATVVHDGEVVIECECPHCHRLFCAQCRVPWHVGLSCREFQLLNEDERGTEDLMVRNLAYQNKWTRCPQCKFFVERTEGCAHITCRCKFQFCYGCGSEWTVDHEGCSGIYLRRRLNQRSALRRS